MNQVSLPWRTVFRPHVGAENLFQQRDKLVDGVLLSTTDVDVPSPGPRHIRSRPVGFHDIIDIDEISCLVAITKDDGTNSIKH